MINLDSLLQETASIEIEADIQQVFRFIATDFEKNYPKWSQEIEKVEKISSGPIALNSELLLYRREVGQTIKSRIRVVDFRKNDVFTLESISEPYLMSYAFVSNQDDCNTTLKFTFHLKKIELIMRPFVKLIRTALRDGAVQSLNNVRSLVTVNNAVTQCM